MRALSMQRILRTQMVDVSRSALIFVTSLTLSSVAQAAPTVSLTAPGDGWAYNVPVTLSLKASAAVDPADTGATLVRVEFYADGQLLGSDATTAYSLTWNGVAVGSHVLTAKAVDSLGQETLSAPRTLIITDSTSNLAPTVSLSAPANNAKYALPADITLTASAADIEKNGVVTQVEFLANGQVVGSAATRPFSFVWSNPAAGTYTLTARATDNLGTQTTSAARTMIVEATNLPPTVSLGGVTAGTYLMPVSFSLTASASGPEVNTPVAQVDFLANDQVIATQTAKPYALTWTPTVPGTYVLAARASDSQGLSATSATRTVTVNAANTAPTVSLTAPANNSIYVLPADLVVSANATDLEKNGGVTQVEFLANGQVIGTSSTKPYSLVWSNPPAGSYSLTARATDTNGAQTVSAARTVTISDVNAPPKVSLSTPANHAVFVAPASITLTASATGPEANTPIAQVEFIADGQVLATVTAKPYSYLWQNASLGSHSLTVRATDSLGAVTTSAVRTITVNANQAPVVSLTSPTANQILPAPATITVTANAIDIDGTIAKVDFYNGATLIGTATAAPYTATWSNVPSGSYSLTAIATDDKGGTTTSAVVPVTVNALPTVSLVAGGTPYVAPANATLTAAAADSDGTITKVEFFNGTALVGTVTSAPYTFTLTGLAAGSYSLTAKATDNLGGTSTSAAVAVTVAANQLPTVNLTSPTPNQIVAAPATLTVSANAADADGTIAKVEFYNGATLIGTATTAPYSAIWNNVPSGLYSLTAVATDDKGGITMSAAVPVTVNALPSVAMTSPSANQVVNAPGSFTLTASATDSDGTIAKVEFYQGATLIGTATAAPYTVTWSDAPAGSYSLTAKATDNLGGTATSAPVAVIVNGLPTVSLTSPTTNAVIAAPATITVTANATDTDGSIAKVDFYQGSTLIGTATTAPYTFTWSNVPAGSYSLTATATDNLGGQVTSAPVAITVDAPPTVTLTSPIDGAVGIAPASFTLTANAADTDGTIAKVEFFNGTTLIGTTTSAPYTLNWDAVSPGNYSLTAKATDNLGVQTTSAALNVSVIANSPPTISLTSPTPNQSFRAPATIALAATASDPDNNLAKVEFFQNGTLISTVLAAPYTATWSNVAQGSYQITAVATDAVGAQTTSAPVNLTVTPTQASLYFIQADHLGTPRLVTDETSAIVWRHLPTTEPFGNTPPEEDPNATGTRFELPLAFPGQYRDRESGLNYNFFRDYDPAVGSYRQSDPIGLLGGINTYNYVNGNPVSYSDSSGLLIEYANHEVSGGMYHSKIIITPDNQAAYVNDPRFQQFDSEGRRFATVGAGPTGMDRLNYGVNRPRDVSVPAEFRRKLDIPCQYGDEDAAIRRLFELGDIYNKHQTSYTLIPRRIFGIPTGWNSNSFISGIGAAAHFNMPAPNETGNPTPGYENPLPIRFFRPRD